MQRITITVDDGLLAELDKLIGARGYRGRSEAIREVARVGIQQALLKTSGASACVAASSTCMTRVPERRRGAWTLTFTSTKTVPWGRCMSH